MSCTALCSCNCSEDKVSYTTAKFFLLSTCAVHICIESHTCGMLDHTFSGHFKEN